jgi:hypothetical protein
LQISSWQISLTDEALSKRNACILAVFTALDSSRMGSGMSFCDTAGVGHLHR